MGAEAGLVTCGSAAGMALPRPPASPGQSGEDRRLPDVSGMRNEIVIHRAHRINYDQMYRVGGGVSRSGCRTRRSGSWSGRSASGRRPSSWFALTGPGALDFEAVVEIAHGRRPGHRRLGLDAAAARPPAPLVRRGADLVIYSGGKGIRGPQDSGMLAGRRDLIRAATLNARSPSQDYSERRRH